MAERRRLSADTVRTLHSEVGPAGRNGSRASQVAIDTTEPGRLDAANGIGRASPPKPDTKNEIVARGREAWGRLKSAKTWEDYKEVGRAFLEGRHEAMAKAQSNKPHGRAYNTEYDRWLARNGFDDFDKSD